MEMFPIRYTYAPKAIGIITILIAIPLQEIIPLFHFRKWKIHTDHVRDAEADDGMFIYIFKLGSSVLL